MFNTNFSRDGLNSCPAKGIYMIEKTFICVLYSIIFISFFLDYIYFKYLNLTMYKKAFILIFFWTIYVSFFCLLLTMQEIGGSTYQIDNSIILIFLKFIGAFMFSILTVWYIQLSINFLKEQNNVN